jgi:hypothetical protein
VARRPASPALKANMPQAMVLQSATLANASMRGANHLAPSAGPLNVTQHLAAPE